MHGERLTHGVLLALGAAVLLVLPFITTFNDVLTGAGMHLGLDNYIRPIVPLIGRTVAGLLGLLGVSAASHGGEIVVHTTRYAQPLFLSWNCLGWQSLVLFGLTLTTGLRGNHSVAARLQAIVVGTMGTVLINLLRITLVCLLAATVGYVPAILFHDYGGTLMVIGWLFAFWMVAYRVILLDESPEESAT